MTHREAAESLNEHFRGNAPWLVAIGMSHEDDRDILIVYVSDYDSAVRKKVYREVMQNGWEGFPVILRHMEQPEPAVTL